MNKKSAYLTGITGQSASFLAELLLEKNYKVFGLIRRTATPNTKNIEHIIKDINIIEGDITDLSSLTRSIKLIKPDEIFNAAGQSHVRISFDQPILTAEVTGIGVLNILEAIRQESPHSKFAQFSSSELYGDSKPPQNELTPFRARSPYACAKLFGYWTTHTYRESYNIFASNAIIFNNESARRGLNFVTRKITRGLVEIKNGRLNCLELGNLDAIRDWSYSPDVMEGVWLMLQYSRPEDFCFGSGYCHTVREFVEESVRIIFGQEIIWEGEGINEVGKIFVPNGPNNHQLIGMPIVKINPKFFRPAEVSYLLADPTKARTKLGWTSKTTFKKLVKLMCEHDMGALNGNK